MPEPKNILVIRYSSLGDVVLTSAPIQNLRKAYPNARIVFTTKAQYKPIVELFEELSGHILYPEPNSIKCFMKYIKALRGEKFDLVVDLHNSLRSRIIRNLIRTGRILIYNNERTRRKTYLNPGEKIPPYKHTVEMYNDTLKLTSSIPLPTRPVLYKALLESKTKEFTIGIVTSAKHPTKTWPGDYFISVSQTLLRRGLNLIIICEDIETFNNLKFNNLPEQMILYRPNLSELITNINQCDLLICGDTGPMHIAGGLSVPVIAIFGPTHPCLGFCPLGDKAELLTLNLECSPCSIHGEKKCYRDRRYCMEDIQPDKVIESVEEIIKEIKGS